MPPPRRLCKKKEKEKDVFKCPDCSKVLTDKSSYQLHQKLHTDEYPYGCTICSYKCKIKKYLSRHVKKVHTKANGPQCPVCGKVFHFNANLKCHMRVHTGEKPYKCPVCRKAFSSTYCLSMHKLIHTDEKPYQCKFCDYACRDSSTLRRHQERHMGIYKTYPCNKCNKTFKRSVALKIHMDEVHYGIETRTFCCDQCDKAFKTKAALKLHVKTVHDKALRTECEICGRTVNKNNILTHLKTHVDIKPYKCSYKPCGHAFKDPSSLKKHTLIHYPEFQYECELCGSRFPRKARLRKHKLSHVATGGVTCHYCDVSFSSKLYLAVHIRKRHSEDCEKFICDECGLHTYSKKAIILHLRYGHGSDAERKCKICHSVEASSNNLIEHYLKAHSVRYVVQNKQRENNNSNIRIKDEPIEVLAEFDFDYDVQKIEVDEYVPDPEYVDMESTLAYSEKVLAEDISRSLQEKKGEGRSESAFDDFYIDHVVENTRVQEQNQQEPENAEPETSISYSRSVLEEDISRSISERERDMPERTFDEFFVQLMNKPKIKRPSKLTKIDKTKIAVVKQTIKKMLCENRIRKEMEILEKMRQNYNKRIQMATKSAEKKDPKHIKYFKKTDNNTEDTLENNNPQPSEPSPMDIDQENSKTEQENKSDQEHITSSQETNKMECVNNKSNEEHNKSSQEDNNSSQERNNPSQEDNNPSQEDNNLSQEDNNPSHETNGIVHDDNKLGQENNKSSQETDEQDQEDDDFEDLLNMSLAKRVKRLRRAVRRDRRGKKTKYSDDGETNKNGKLTFMGHECYICFKLFKTKEDLTHHCREHFDICNEKMLKKCPFCGYVTNLNIKRHIEVVHKINIHYAYGHITEKENRSGSKYVFEIDKDCELEIIPSISNLNKIACMKIDEKNRQNKNAFMGKTKLVKKGGNWVIEKEAVPVSTEFLLPEFTEEEYKKLKFEGDSYCDRMKYLALLAKKRGLKMLYPCTGCEKICQTLSALKLHNRKHDPNPKQYKPKVWVNRHIEYVTKKRKKLRRSNKNARKNKETAAIPPVKRLPVKPVKLIKDTTNIVLDNRKKKTDFDVEHRFAAPKPVKNKHKCDKKLIEFYNSNIKGKDIEFWQFLKIFNKMSRENVNDFKDLENRNDSHFGVHIKDKKEPEVTDEVPVEKEPEPVLPKSVDKKKVIKKKFTRSIMISRKEYMRRNEIKNEMRKRLEEARVQ